ncbi:hypothetical protein [Aeromonas hydrophila]|uniref:hypothetical protein n=1 Tax=Aeromonas hydrophila TaxID=644 RepID=UPI00191F20ED|nr:hypothetical protein [Aeromonas hydrophila]MBL0574163.1 hypothetical protein [Aeromonas hydrophila]
MPKYFEETRELPDDIVGLSHEELRNDVLTRFLENKSGLTTFSVKLPGLPDNSLGYVFFVRTMENLHTVLDIKGVVHFRGINTEYLVRIIKHASGIEFDVEVQSEFHRIRNEIGID